MEHTGKIRIYKVEDRERVAGILSGEHFHCEIGMSGW